MDEIKEVEDKKEEKAEEVENVGEYFDRLLMRT